MKYKNLSSINRFKESNINDKLIIRNAFNDVFKKKVKKLNKKIKKKKEIIKKNYNVIKKDLIVIKKLKNTINNKD